jgi:hypothetical protein
MSTLTKIICAAILILACYNGNAQTIANKQINITSLTAGAKANKLFINWSTDGSVQTNYFEVQRSDDGNTFKTVALVLGADPQQTGDSYVYAEPVKKNSDKHVYFRVCHIDTNGAAQLSKMIEL